MSNNQSYETKPRPTLSLAFLGGMAATQEEALAELWNINPYAAAAHEADVLKWERNQAIEALHEICQLYGRTSDRSDLDDAIDKARELLGTWATRGDTNAG